MHINYYLWKKCCYLAVGCNDISNRYNVFCACHHITNIHNKPLKTIDNPFTIKSAHSPTNRTNDRKITNKIHKNNEHECTMYELVWISLYQRPTLRNKSCWTFAPQILYNSKRINERHSNAAAAAVYLFHNL